MWKLIIDVFPVMMCFLLADNTVGTVHARIQKVIFRNVYQPKWTKKAH